MAGKVLGAILVVAACCWGVTACASPEPRTPPQAAVSRPATQPMSTPQAKPQAEPLPDTGCARLLRAYRHEVSHIPYPANIPYLTLLGVGAKLVRRARRSDDDPVCQAQLRVIMEPLFKRGVGPGVVPLPPRPSAAKR